MDHVVGMSQEENGDFQKRLREGVREVGGKSVKCSKMQLRG